MIRALPGYSLTIERSAFRRGQTVADMLRDLLAREFPDKDRDPQ
jgi:hypothetical protein